MCRSSRRCCSMPFRTGSGCWCSTRAEKSSAPIALCSISAATPPTAAAGRQAQEFLPLNGYAGIADVFKSVVGGSRVTLRNQRFNGEANTTRSTTFS